MGFLDRVIRVNKDHGAAPVGSKNPKHHTPRPPPPRPKSVNPPAPKPTDTDVPELKRTPSRNRPAPTPGRGTLLRVKKSKEMVARPPTTGKSSRKVEVLSTLKRAGKDFKNPFSNAAEIIRSQGVGRDGSIGYHCYNCRNDLAKKEEIKEATLFKCHECDTISSSLIASRVNPNTNSPTDTWKPVIKSDDCMHWVRILSEQELKQLKDKIDDLKKLDIEEIKKILTDEYEAIPDEFPVLYEDRRQDELIQNLIAYQDFNDPYKIKTGYVREIMGNGELFWSKVGQFRSEFIGIPEVGLHLECDEYENISGAPFPDRIKWFREKLNKLRWEDEYEGPLRIVVNRDSLLEESSNWICALHGLDRWRTTRYEFHGEPAMDSGGVAKEWYRLVCDSVFKPEYGLFERSDLDDITYDFNPSSELYQPERHLHYYRFAGRILAKAIFEGCFVDAHLTKVIYKHILERPCSFSDLKYYDKHLFQNLKSVLEEPELLEDLELSFSIGTTVMGEPTEVELKEMGADLDVTKDNFSEYLRLFLKFYFYQRTELQLNTFLKGFHEIIPAALVSIFNAEEFEQIMCGMNTVDTEDWKNNVTYRREYKEQGENHQVIQWFWEVVEALTDEDRAKLLQFITGSSRVPVGGFASFASGNSMIISIESITTEMSVFPRAHTCFNRLELPLYETKQETEDRVKFALEFTNGFNLE